LIFERWNPAAAEGVVAGLDDRGKALWAAAVGDWGDGQKHAAFVKYCSAAGTLGAAGRHYRARLDAHPKDTIARDMQNRIVAMATVQLPTLAVTTVREPVTRSRWFWGIMFLFAVAGILGGAIFGR
jgi:hypothetical protein